MVDTSVEKPLDEPRTLFVKDGVYYMDTELEGHRMRTPTYSGINAAFYNINWRSFCSSSDASKMLKQDVRGGFDKHHVDVLLLSGCCGGKDFGNFMKYICPERDFAVFCQSSYACIVRKSTIKIIKAPKLKAAPRSS